MFVILNAIYGQKFPLRLRLLGSLGFIVLLFIVVTVFSRVNSDSWQHDFMIAILVMVVLINVGTAIFQGKIDVQNISQRNRFFLELPYMKELSSWGRKL